MTSITPEHQPGEGDPPLKLVLERSRETPGEARAAVVAFCEHAGLSESTLSTVKLLVSEVVTNAVVHPVVGDDATIELFARLWPGLIRVEVFDQGAGFHPAPRDPRLTRSGYGLFLLEKQAARWGTDRGAGNRVWFEVSV